MESKHVLHSETCSTVGVSHILNHLQDDSSHDMTTAIDKKKTTSMGIMVSHQNTFICVSIF